MLREGSMKMKVVINIEQLYNNMFIVMSYMILKNCLKLFVVHSVIIVVNSAVIQLINNLFYK